MIITIFSEDDSTTRSILVANLAALCALNHHKVLLIDATSQKYSSNWGMQRSVAGIKPKLTVHAPESLHSVLGNLVPDYSTHYRELIIDADGVDSWKAESALIATDVLVIPIQTHQSDLRGQDNLIQRIEKVRLFNPALRVLVVDVQTISAFSDTAKREFDAAAAFTKKILAATLADEAIHEWTDVRRAFDRGLSTFESAPTNERAAAEIKGLYQQILKVKDMPMDAANSIAVMNAVQQAIHGKPGN